VGCGPAGWARGVRCTQLDPIGLGGGLNLYGFAGGDPVNFSDPFGLCPTNLRDVPRSRVYESCRHVDMDRAAAEVIRQAIGKIKTTGECKAISEAARRLQKEGKIGLFKDRSGNDGYTHGKGGKIDVDVDTIDPENLEYLAKVIAHETVHHLKGAEHPSEEAYDTAQKCTSRVTPT